MALSRRRRLEVEALEHRYAPSTATTLSGSIQLAPHSAAPQPNSGGVMVYKGTATFSSKATGTLTGTFTETIRPMHAHGHSEITVANPSHTFTIKLLENFKPTTGATQAFVGLKVNGQTALGQATGNTNFASGAAKLTFSTSAVHL